MCVEKWANETQQQKTKKLTQILFPPTDGPKKNYLATFL